MTPQNSFTPLHEILFQTTARYLNVRPHGIEVGHGRPALRTIEVRVLGHGGARTLYRGRRPVCRSLDGIAAVRDAGKLCALCPDHEHCTPQVRVDLLFESRPHRLLLSFTSAKNFLQYLAEAKARGHDLVAVRTEIDVTSRGSWGELRFSEIAGSLTTTPRSTAAPDDRP